MKINRIRASMIATLSFFIENIYNCYICLLAQWYTNLLSPDKLAACFRSSVMGCTTGTSLVSWWSSSANQFVPEIVSPFPCLSGLVRHTVLVVHFFKRTQFFYWLPWQMPHQRFQHFDKYCGEFLLTVYHTIPTFNNLEKEAFWKHC